mgnify:CR=1 FL=1
MATGIDALDRKILRVLQHDATLGLDEIAAQVGSSKTPVWNRIRKLREAGVEAEWTRHCTYADPARFYSFRRATHRGEATYGRQGAFIGLG